VHFAISQLAVSGIKVNRLDMYGEVRKSLLLYELRYLSFLLFTDCMLLL